jgi:hypothetical protein
MIRSMLLGTALAFGLVTVAVADVVKFLNDLLAAEENPPTNSKGTGTVNGTLDTQSHKLEYTVSWSGLASPVTAAHFHGPAERGKNAGVQVPIGGNNPTSPVTGSATLSAEQQQQLISGLWYVNVHTQNNPSGAIRGQLTLSHP